MIGIAQSYFENKRKHLMLEYSVGSSVDREDLYAELSLIASSGVKYHYHKTGNQ
jgi:hypothetical protein